MKLAETAIDRLFISAMPEKLVGGKAYDSGKPDAELLKKQRVALIAPHRRNRAKPRTQDGRLSGSLPGFRISEGWLSGMNVMLTIF